MTELELTSDSWLRERELLRRVPFSRSTLWREVKAGRFPSPTKLSPNTTAWLWSEVAEHLKGRQGGQCESPVTEERLPTDATPSSLLARQKAAGAGRGSSV